MVSQPTLLCDQLRMCSCAPLHLCKAVSCELSTWISRRATFPCNLGVSNTWYYLSVFSRVRIIGCSCFQEFLNSLLELMKIRLVLVCWRN